MAGRTPRTNSDSARINPDSPDFATVAAKALGHVDTILLRLFPNGVVQQGGEFHTLNPRRSDHSIGSFSVNMETGKWADFAVAGAKGGDLISYVAYVFRLEQHEAAAGLDPMLGVGLFDHDDAPDGTEFRRLSEAELKAAKLAIIKRETTSKIADQHGPSGPAPIASEPEFGKLIIGHWSYLDSDGHSILCVLRSQPALRKGEAGKKHFFPMSYRDSKQGGGNWRWVMSYPDGPRPNYNLDQLALRPDAPVACGCSCHIGRRGGFGV